MARSWVTVGYFENIPCMRYHANEKFESLSLQASGGQSSYGGFSSLMFCLAKFSLAAFNLSLGRERVTNDVARALILQDHLILHRKYFSELQIDLSPPSSLRGKKSKVCFHAKATERYLQRYFIGVIDLANIKLRSRQRQFGMRTCFRRDKKTHAKETVSGKRKTERIML